MSPSRFLRALPIVIAALLLSVLCMVLFRLAAGQTAIGAGLPIFAGIERLVGVLRTYIFRNAIGNTFWVAVGASLFGLLLAWPLARRAARGRPLQRVVIVAVLLPLAMPVGLAGIAWRELAAPFDAILHRPSVALALLALAHGWRAVPIAFGLLLVLGRGRRGLTVAASATIYLVLADAGIVLLVTGGAPFNATHLWASWIFQQSIAGGQTATGAAMALFLLPLLVLVLVTMLALFEMGRGIPATGRSDSGQMGAPSGHLAVVIIVIIVIALALPWLALVVQVGPPSFWPGLVLHLLAQTDFVWWWVNTLLLVTAAAGAAWLAARIARAVELDAVLTRLLAVLALALWPLLYLPASWLHTLWMIPDRRLTLLVLYIAIAACAGAGIAHAGPPGSRLLPWALGLGFFMVAHDFGLAFALEDISRTLDLSTGIVTRLSPFAADAGMVQAMAVLLSGTLTLIIGSLAARL